MSETDNPMDVNTGQGIPGWVLRVEGACHGRGLNLEGLR